MTPTPSATAVAGTSSASSDVLPAAGAGAISLRDVTKRYADERVVDRVSLEIAPGEFFSLLGPSGSGKTTTLMMIAGFASIEEGRILVDGVDVAAQPPQRRGFGMVFQNYAIFPHLDVFENVAFPLRARGVASDEVRSRVADALALVRLERFGDRYARQLSGGQQQRVAIARAIVFRPKVVLMDEPLGALDKNLRYEMQVEIKDIQRRLGMTVVYVTHDQEEAMNMSDRIGIMNRGRVEQVGAPTEIYERPDTTFIGRFLGEANLLGGKLREVTGGVGTVALPGGLALRARASKPFAAGSRVSLFVRPERIALVPGNLTSKPAHPAPHAEVTAFGGPRSTHDRGGSPDQVRGRLFEAPLRGAPQDEEVGGFRSGSHDAENRVAGRIRRTSFLGNIVRYAVDAGGVDITVDVQNVRARRLEAGEPVTVSWSAEDSLLLEGAA